MTDPFANSDKKRALNYRCAHATRAAASLILLTIMCGALSCKVKSLSRSASSKPVVPAWSLPGSATHKQVPPPAGFHRTTVTNVTPIGIFDGQSDIGAALIPGSSTYNPGLKTYTITSAGYNIWYNRDEFRFLWKKLSGDVSLATDVKFPDTAGYADRKAVVIIRQSLDDDAEEAMVARHGGGLMHLAWRSEKNNMVVQMLIPQKSAMRIGIEKKGAAYSIWVSLNGEPMHQLGYPVQLKFKEPFYVGIGFCSHVPDKSDTAIFSNIILENSAGKVR